MKKFNERALRIAYEEGELDETLGEFLENRFKKETVYNMLDEMGLLDNGLEWALEEYIKECRDVYGEAAMDVTEYRRGYA